MSEITELENLYKKLKEPLPKEAITKHPTKTYLSSIKSIYITDRLNSVFGVGGFHIVVDVIDIDKSNGMVLVKITFKVPKYDIFLQCIAGNDNGGASSKNFDLGDAAKGAITDALSKVASWLGIGEEVYQGKAASKAANKASLGLKEFKTRPDDLKKWLNETIKGESTLTNEFIAAKGYIAEGYTVQDLRGWWKINNEVAQKLTSPE